MLCCEMKWVSKPNQSGDICVGFLFSVYLVYEYEVKIFLNENLKFA